MRFLDKDFELIVEIEEYASLIWHEKYYETGVVEFQAAQYVENAKYIYNTANQQLGIIEKIEQLESYKYSGFTLEYILQDRVINKKMTFQNKSKEEIVNLLLVEFASDIVDITTTTTGNNIPVTQVFGDNLLTYCQDTLKSRGKGIRIDYDYVLNKKTAVIYEGTDNTINKEPLAENFDNIIKDTFTIDKTGYRNYAYIVGEDENQIVVELDMRKDNTEAKKEMFVDGSSITRISQVDDVEITLTESEYRQALHEYGFIIMIRYNTNLKIIITPYPDEFELGEQRFYQGIHIATEQRVLEILTGWHSGVVEKNIILGGG